MKKFLLPLIAVVLLVACNKEKEQKIEKKTEPLVDATIPIDTMGEWVRLVMKESKGVMRGYELGDALDSVKKYEKAQIHEDRAEKKFITYTFDVDDDFVDITYEYNDQKKIKSIKINAVVNGVESFLEDFTKFYDIKYGVGKIINDSTKLWKSKKGYQIKLVKRKHKSEAMILIE